MVIKILGGGCSNCKKLYHNTILALSETNTEAEVVKVTDYQQISNYNVMRTPALVINEQVVSNGQVLSKDQIIELIIKVK